MKCGKINIEWKDDPFIKGEMERTKKIINEYEKAVSNHEHIYYDEKSIGTGLNRQPYRGITGIVSRGLQNEYDYEKNRLKGIVDGYRFDNIHFNYDKTTTPPTPVVHFDRYDQYTDFIKHGILEGIPSWWWHKTH